MGYKPSPACMSATPLEFVTHGTLSTDKALQLTISKDRRVIGVPLHMGRGFFLFQGRPTVSLHFMEGIQTYCGSLHYQDNSTMTVIINTCGVYCACKQNTTADQQTWTYLHINMDNDPQLHHTREAANCGECCALSVGHSEDYSPQWHYYVSVMASDGWNTETEQN